MSQGEDSTYEAWPQGQTCVTRWAHCSMVTEKFSPASPCSEATHVSSVRRPRRPHPPALPEPLHSLTHGVNSCRHQGPPGSAASTGPARTCSPNYCHFDSPCLPSSLINHPTGRVWDTVFWHIPELPLTGGARRTGAPLLTSPSFKDASWPLISFPTASHPGTTA